MPPPDGPDRENASSPRARLRLRYVFYVFAAAVLALIVAAAGAVGWSLHGIHFPSPAEVTSRRVILITSADGQNLFQKTHLQLAPIDAKDMPPDVVNAVLSIEDRRFYEHGPVDLPSVLRAFRDNLLNGKTVAGGSTITQQLVKILFLDPERTYERKIR